MKVSYTSAMVQGLNYGSQNPGLINKLPEEIILTIFENCKTVLPALASVNKSWKQITGTKAFYTAMFSQAFAACCFGKADLKTYFGMDLGLDEVPHLHLKDYGDIETGLCLLTYFPKEIPIEDKNGVINGTPPSAKIIGELVKNPKCGYATGFDPNSYFPAINEEREIKGGEWIVTYRTPIGYSEEFDAQMSVAEKQGQDTDIAEFDKTIYAVFMHYVKTGERCFLRDPAKRCYSLIRFKEKIDGWKRITCGFGPSGLRVHYNVALDGDYIGVAAQRKSIGT